MSWSFQVIGKPENVAKALEEFSGTLTGQSKVEYDDAMPHLAALVRQNFAKDGSHYTVPTLNFAASGSGLAAAGEQQQRTFQVKIEPMYTKIV